MRREGFELSVSRPRVVMIDGENGEKLEPIEDVVIDVDDEFSGVVIEKMTKRKATITEMKPSGIGKHVLYFPHRHAALLAICPNSVQTRAAPAL